MGKLIYYILFILFFQILLHSCANRAAPPGGPRDRQPPQIIPEKSTPNQQVNFSAGEIELTFDEWVTLDDPLTQILISPPLVKQPEIQLRGKTLSIQFDEEEVLRPNTTYTINLGSSIKDITEKNELEENLFVFSTGSTIDSLYLVGQVVDLVEQEPVEGAKVMLYEPGDDSVVFDQRPYYAAVTGDDGQYRITNVKPGQYKAVAINDLNLNYLYDPFTEDIAFKDSLITIQESAELTADFALSMELSPLRVEERELMGPGRLKIAFNRIPAALDWRMMEQEKAYGELTNRELNIWYNPALVDSSFSVILVDTVEGLVDTLRFREEDIVTQLVWDPGATRGTVVTSGQDAELCFMAIPERVEPSLILVNGDPMSSESVSRYDSLPRCVFLSHPWNADSSYIVHLLPGALTTAGGNENDSIEVRVQVSAEEDFGEYQIAATGTMFNYNYIFNIRKNDEIVLTQQKSGGEIEPWSSGLLAPGNYILEVIEDRNKNGRWDPALYMTGTQPEKIQRYELEQLRANWDVEVRVQWQEDQY